MSLHAARLSRARYGRQTLHAEWTKLRTLASTGWLLLAVAVLTIVVSVAADASATCQSGGCQTDPAKLSLTGEVVVQRRFGDTELSGDIGVGEGVEPPGLGQPFGDVKDRGSSVALATSADCHSCLFAHL